MDLFKKIFGEKDDHPDDKSKDIKKSPARHAHVMSPLELQKHIEGQMREILKSFDNDDENLKPFDENILDEFGQHLEFDEQLKQLFENHNNYQNSMVDIELDGKIPTAQIETFLHRLPSGMSSSPQPKFQPSAIKKRTDIEKIMDKIHGTVVEDIVPVRPKRANSPAQHFSQANKTTPKWEGMGRSSSAGINDGSVRTYGQSIISQTIRKPDGSYETKRTVRDSDGISTTTITKMIDGKTESFTYKGDAPAAAGITTSPPNRDHSSATLKSSDSSKILVGNIDQNLMVSRDGYIIPKNFWKY